ncbi:hypothetical protein JTB14_012006 [Gonioctena quinquepunctata]|nr:hypothetical protein JTB14_012006 [Gonioctena quinquepunctata]
MSIYRGRNKREFYLSSLLYESIDDNNLCAVKSLLSEKGADPNIVLPKKGISPFHLAIGCDSSDFTLKVTCLILQHGGNPNVRSDDSLTPVHIAAAWGRLEVLQLLLNCGGDPEARDNNYMTPFHYAKKEAFVDCLELLRNHLTDKTCIMNREEEDCIYNLELDKVVVNNGYTIGEYEVLANANSITKEKTVENLENLPQTDTTEYVLNWFSKHVDDVGGKTFVKIPASTGNSSEDESFFSFESSNDESDNASAKKTNAHEITFRKTYRKKRKISKDSSSSRTPANVDCGTIFPGLTQRKLEFSPSIGFDGATPTKSTKTSLELINHAVSSESGILSLPNSKDESLASFKRSEALNQAFRDNTALPNNSITSEKYPVITGVHAIQNIFEITEDLSNGDESAKKSEDVASTDQSFVSVSEIYKYEDMEKGVVLYEKRLLKAASDCNGSIRTLSFSASKMSFLPETFEYDSDSLRKELRLYGYNPGPITFTTERVYLKKLYQLKNSHGVKNYVNNPAINNNCDCNGSIGTLSFSSKMSSLPETFEYDSDTLRKELTLYGYNPGPITLSTKRVYLKKLYHLKNSHGMNNFVNNSALNNHFMNTPWVVTNSQQCSRKVYSVELEKSVRNPDLSGDLALYKSLEENVSKEFSNPDPARKWREGISKSSFAYLLLDPSVTNNLPCRADSLQPKEIWETFLSAIFYVGKGKRSRPYSHLYEAVALWRQGRQTSENKKLQKILDIWKHNGGVICLHVFQNIIPVEAYTREAAMISAIKIENISNMKSGEFYGIAATWPQKHKKMYGVYLLYRAMKIFLNEGERQLFPSDIN